jgi:hypothetical protein
MASLFPLPLSLSNSPRVEMPYEASGTERRCQVCEPSGGETLLFGRSSDDAAPLKKAEGDSASTGARGCGAPRAREPFREAPRASHDDAKRPEAER